ncbi:MAG: hypothetical protein JWR52_1633 [Marmoricola sp.]|nr:hypothetical protein [Marmoricola sp.]
MYPSKEARELAILLRISRELDIVGDLTATVDNPSELLAWANILDGADILAWRAKDSGHRYVQVTANRTRAPIRGRVTAVLPAEQHPDFWNALAPADLDTGIVVKPSLPDLVGAWSQMPITAPDLESA